MRLAIIQGSIAAALAVASGATGEPATVLPAPGPPEFFRPAEAPYQHLWLTFDGGPPIRAFIALRAGKAVSTWFIANQVPGGAKTQGSYRLLIDSNSLTADGSLRGSISMRQVSIWAPIARVSQLTLTIDAAKSGAGYQGSWKTEILGGATAQGSVSGEVIEEPAIRAAQTYIPSADWPTYAGPYATGRATETSTALLDDLSAAQPLWRSEQPLLSGWGTGTDSRYTSRAAVGTLCGGAGTPVFANGRIFLYHYIPSGEPDPARLAGEITKLEAAFKDPLPIERDGTTNYLRPMSDTVVSCIDPQTGGTIWRTTFPRLSGNFQTHKWRGFNPTATVIGATVIANDYGHNWVALDAKDGAVRWTLPGKQVVSGNSAVPGATAAGKLAILPGNPVRAVDAVTGQLAWQSNGGGPQALAWGAAGHEKIVILGSTPTCVDAASGKILWKIDAPLVANTGSTALISGDFLVGHIHDTDKTKRGGYFQGWKMSDTSAERLWQDEFLGFDENLTVTIGQGKAYLVGLQEVRCLDLATGKLLSKQTIFEGHGPGSNQWLAVVGDRLLLAPEGQHGGQGFRWMDASSLALIGPSWSPAQNHTTAYGMHSMGFPVVDGRIFVRGMDGLYCYDLRKK